MLHVHKTTDIIKKLSLNINESIATNIFPSSSELIIHELVTHSSTEHIKVC